MNIFINNFSKVSCLFFLTLLLSACQTSDKLAHKNVYVNENLYFDEYFPNYQAVKVESKEDIFALDDRMRLMVKEKLMTERDIKRRARKLLKHIFDQDNVALAYNSAANVSAIGAYNNQQANCLSLTIMAYALAKEAQLAVDFQEVKIPEYWVRNGAYNMLTGHVNLVVTKPKSPHAQVVFGSDILTIDFDPFVIKASFPKTIISQSYVLSMFYSNKGAQALVNKQLTKAYAYFKAATTLAPNFSPAWANLGILYRMSGHLALAKKSYQYALEVNPENFTAMSNMSLLLDNLKDRKELANIRKTLKNQRENNPYYFALLANQAFYLANNKQALAYYRQAIKLNKHEHAFYFGLAKVYYALNENRKAQRAMGKAILYNRINSIDVTYIAKLNFLKKQELDH
ncbi:tetratricopeptide repeat protein [Colwellia sp. MB02u-14]|uniref:tetratricopeptide repeat protein n=1 Tax=Colwellia sp. MB02u-14 TaxID=2759815 RepID=UPI0015F56514|nr:tetratricopeptide repeat protein [Colwellia sp. MB02u-14]MBA6302916.1 tetratricopeptide repeat protein [Colwellia sp. MB02u-14]